MGSEPLDVVTHPALQIQWSEASASVLQMGGVQRNLTACPLWPQIPNLSQTLF